MDYETIVTASLLGLTTDSTIDSFTETNNKSLIGIPADAVTLFESMDTFVQASHTQIAASSGRISSGPGQLWFLTGNTFNAGDPTGIPADGTIYNFDMVAAEGGSASRLYSVTLNASDIQTFGSLVSELNNDLGVGTGASGLQARLNSSAAAPGINIFSGSDAGVGGTVRFASPAAVFYGLDHLIGASVDIISDGATHPQRVVASNGKVSLQSPASNIIVGLSYIPELELLHPEPFSGDSTRVQQFQPRYINFLVQDTIGTDIVFQDEDGNVKRTETIPARSFGDLMDAPVPPFTGTTRVSSTGWETPFNLIIRQNIPMPITMLSVIMQFAIDEA
jgi:hypothetical protein